MNKISEKEISPWLDRMVKVAENVEGLTTKQSVQVAVHTEHPTKQVLEFLSSVSECLGVLKFAASVSKNEAYAVLDNKSDAFDEDFWECLHRAENEFINKNGTTCSVDLVQGIGKSSDSTSALSEQEGNNHTTEKFVDHNLDNSDAFYKAKSLSNEWSRLLGAKSKQTKIPMSKLMPSTITTAIGNNQSKKLSTPLKKSIPIAGIFDHAAGKSKRTRTDKNGPNDNSGDSTNVHHATDWVRLSSNSNSARPSPINQQLPNKRAYNCKDPYCQSKWNKYIRQRSFCYNRPKGIIPLGKQIVYWVTGTFRVEDNWALRLAMHLSELLSLPVVAIAFINKHVHDGIVASTSSAKVSGIV